MRDTQEDDALQTEIRLLVEEIQSDAEKLNIVADRSAINDDLKHAIASLADKINGLHSLIR